MCLVDTSSSADCCLTLSSAVWLLIGPEASTSRRPSDQLQMWNERGQFCIRRSMFHMKQKEADRHLVRLIKSEQRREGGRKGGTGDLSTAGVCFVSLCFHVCKCVCVFLRLLHFLPSDQKTIKNVWHHHGDHNN